MGNKLHMRKSDFMSMMPKPKVSKIIVDALCGKEVFIREMVAADDDSYNLGMIEITGMKDDGTPIFKAGDLSRRKLRYLVRVLCDEDGARLFDDSKEAETELGQTLPAVIDEIFLKAMKANGDTKEAEKEQEKNSGTEAKEDSSSVSA